MSNAVPMGRSRPETLGAFGAATALASRSLRSMAIAVHLMGALH